MKKVISIILCSLLICSFTACTSQNNSEKNNSSVSSSAESSSSDNTASSENDDSHNSSEPVSDSSEDSAESSSEETSDAASDDVSDTELSETEKKVSELLEAEDFEGVLYAEKNGRAAVAYIRGNNEKGEPYTAETPMPVGSMSKQFCAAAVMLLQEQNKLSINDTLDKYYPEYKNSDKVTLKSMLSMRSGIKNFEESLYDVVSADKSDEENTEAVMKWLFSTPAPEQTDVAFAYSNTNYFLLSNIVESVSGKKYIDFLRENFFSPLGMNHTGSIEEMTKGAEWANGVSYKNIDLQPGLTKGAGDLITTAEDTTTWLNALSTGKVISEESFKAMITNYSPGNNYGFGFFTSISDGFGHPGLIGSYCGADYMDTENNITIFFSSSTLKQNAVLTTIDQVANIVKGE